MRAVIQKVLSAAVVVDGKEISRINKGLMCLIGIGTNDTPSDMDYIVKKILNMRLFPDLADDETLNKQWAKSVMDIQGEVLCVSQFTLHASVKKGSKPDFHGAMSTIPSREFYHKFLTRMGETYTPSCIKDGEFGAMMQVSLINEGPVTIIVDSKEPKNSTGMSTPANTSDTGKAGESINGNADRQAYLLAKQLKREETARRQRENQEKKAFGQQHDAKAKAENNDGSAASQQSSQPLL